MNHKLVASPSSKAVNSDLILPHPDWTKAGGPQHERLDYELRSSNAEAECRGDETTVTTEIMVAGGGGRGGQVLFVCLHQLSFCFLGKEG